MWYSRLTRRGILEVIGPDSSKFLQGLVTNDVPKVLQNNGSMMYAGMLNPKGRMMAEVMVFRDSDERYLIDVSLDCMERIQKHLSISKIRKKVTISNVSDTHSVFHTCELLLGNPLDGKMTKDPRWHELGMRGILRNDSQVEKEFEKLGLRSENESVYDNLRMHHGVAEGLEVDGSIPLEFNLELLNGVSFQKGCYVGQELTARTHFQGLVRKRLLPLELSGPVVAESQDIVHIETETKVGKLVATNNAGFGLGLIRLQEGMKSSWTVSPVLKVGDVNITLGKIPGYLNNVIQN